MKKFWFGILILILFLIPVNVEGKDKIGVNYDFNLKGNTLVVYIKNNEMKKSLSCDVNVYWNYEGMDTQDVVCVGPGKKVALIYEVGFKDFRKSFKKVKKIEIKNIKESKVKNSWKELTVIIPRNEFVYMINKKKYGIYYRGVAVYYNKNNQIIEAVEYRDRFLKNKELDFFGPAFYYGKDIRVKFYYQGWRKKK